MRILLYFSNILIPIIMAGIIIMGLAKKVDVFDAFAEGAADGAKTVAKVMPSLIGLMCAVAVLRESTALDIITFVISPVAAVIGFPAAAVPVAVMRLISSSAAMGMVLDIFKTMGPDSFTGRVVSVMMGCTETVFYTLSVYTASCGIKKTGYVVKGAVLANLAGVAASFVICWVIWG